MPAGTDTMVVMFGIIGVVILLAALASGPLERSRVPAVVIFLVIGALLGRIGAGLITVDLDSAVMRDTATLGLILVLFTDAVGIRFAELRRQWRIAAVALGPGTMLTALAGAAAAHWLLGTSWPLSGILGAALASTDPVLIRPVLRAEATPAAARTALRIESGMNDAVLLPVVLVAMTFIAPAAHETSWAMTAVRVLGLGAGAGLLVGFVAVSGLDLVRRRVGVRRDYESLYVLGVALTSFALAELTHGSGFIATFVAGLTIAALDVEMCDCFFDYGEATAEMALLFTFVAFGVSVIWSAFTVITPATIAFALIAIFARPLVLLPFVLPLRLDRRALFYALWFGPRGLSSLLLVLVPVFAGATGAAQLFPVAALVVLLSILIHGGSQIFLLRPPGGMPMPELTEATHAAAPAPVSPTPPRRLPVLEIVVQGEAPRATDDIRATIEEYHAASERNDRAYLLDVRTDSSFDDSDAIASGSVRVNPLHAASIVTRLGLPYDAWLFLYCT